MTRITSKNARNIDLRYLKRLLVEIDKQEDFISLRFCFYLASGNTVKIIVSSDQMSSKPETTHSTLGLPVIELDLNLP